jgi:RNA polymerase sigma factor (sigma-70 family)
MHYWFFFPNLAEGIDQMPDIKDNHYQQELWKLFLGGDKKSFEAIYHHYVQLLYNYGRKFSTDEQVIEDAIHEVFLSIWKGRANLAVPVSVRYYLCTSLKRAIVRQFSKLDLQSGPLVQEEYQNTLSPEISIEEQIIDRENAVSKMAEVKDSYNKLSQAQQQAVFLKFYQGKSTEEIAGIMGMGRQAIYKLIQRAIVQMRKSMPIFFF